MLAWIIQNYVLVKFVTGSTDLECLIIKHLDSNTLYYYSKELGGIILPYSDLG